MQTLKGKTLFITGASRGIGREIALRAAKDGANVVIAAKTSDPHPKLQGTIHSVAAEVDAAGGKGLALQLDIRDDMAIREGFEKAAKHFGGIDILVNNASAISLTPTLETPAKRFDLMLGVNARGTFLCSQAAIPFLKASAKAGRNPHVLTMSPPISIKPEWFQHYTAYTMSKYGMSMCTMGMAAEFAKEGIAFNSLWPRTTIVTAAVEVHFPEEILKASRLPAIMADAAHVILTSDARKNTGNFYIDEKLLRDSGVTNFDHYALNPGTELFQDIFVE
ncbi:short chain dehydrogenase [Betaproteobacteria bacterium GR16-43]|nr:short chain dehydrogenase [Betaproteobacteria bacterium GR16-43]